MTTVPTPIEAGTYARLPLGEAFSVMVTELDVLLSRLCRNDPRLVLEPEGDQWIVVDTANNDVVMLRTPDRMTALRFARTFVIQTEGATLDETAGAAGGTDGESSPAAPADSTQRRLKLIL